MKTIDEVRTVVGQLPQTSLPVALLPVQIQTRFVTRDGVQQLLVRVYPDELHLDGHDPGLTAAEVEWGKRAWTLAWPKLRGTDAERAAWTPLAERFGRQRAEWIARRLRPTNLNQRPQTVPVFPDPGPLRNPNVTAPVLAKHLPDRWVVMAYRGGLRVLLEVGAPIAQQLTVGPTFDAAPLPDPGPDKLPLDAGLRWLVDFAEAERIGMGIRIVIPPELANATFETLIVFGVRASLAPPAAAAELEALLDAQRYTRGLAFVAPGTPTNNTPDVSSGFRRSERDAGASFESAPVAAKAGSDGTVAARLLGIQPARIAGLEGAARTDDLDARQLQTALWPVTGGYYLDQIMASPDGQPPTFSPDQLEQARRHVLDFVRQLGPLPTIRAGRQPYGLLPAISLDLLAASAGSRFVGSLRFMRDVWRVWLFQVPRLTPGAQNADALVEILRIQPSSVGYRVRLAMDSHFFAPTDVFSSTLSDHLKSHEALLRSRLQGAIAAGLAGQERFFQIIPADAAVDLRSPLIAPGVQVPGAPLNPNYITFLRTASFDDILAEHVPGGAPNSLLYLLLRHSVLLAYATTAQRILVRKGQLPNQRYREPAFVDIVGPDPPFPTLTSLRAAITDPTLRASLHTLTASQEPEAAALEELRAALKHLEALPVDVLARQLSGCLDLFGYRLDAWITSLATRRLGELRQATPRGLALGGFGWVQNVGPSPRTPVATAPPGEGDGPLFAAREAGGFIHAPSLTHASAAAVLRSGYLAHAGNGDAGALAVDLASARVRLAESLLDGIRQGQKLGALLGYRFERGLHERQLDRFIAGFRRVAWLAAVYNAQAALEEALLLPPGFERIQQVRFAQRQLTLALAAVRAQYQLPPSAGVPELEAQAAAKVVDGLVLSQLHQVGAIPFDRLGVPVGNDQPALEAELAALDAALDALSDALTAESVFQLVRGNPNRASATVDAVAHGEIPPPELQFPETPRPGVALTHRLAVVLSGAAPAVPAGVRNARRAAEPNLDAWLKQMVGDVASVRFRAEFLDADGHVLLARENLRLTSLALSNTDALYLSASGRPGLPSDLERLVEYQLRRGAPAVPLDATVRFGYGRVPGTTPAELSLGEFLELNEAFRTAILGARPLDGRDFVQASSDTPTSVDDAELRGRADRAVAALRQARDELAAQLAAPQPALETLRQRLVDLVFLGIAEALPVSPRGNAPSDRNALRAHATAVKEEADRRLARAPATADARTRLEAVFGRGFRVLPLVRPPGAAQIGSALAASDALLGGDPLQAYSWLQGVGRVRPGASRLGKALGYAAALQRPGALDLKVAQLPFVAGERWVGLRLPAGKSFPPGKLSLVVHLPRPFQAAQPLAGLVLDEWTETVPAPEVTTGVAFNYDAPGARPPQAVLLAVAPPGPARWDVETLEKTLLETLELAQLRALDPQALGGDDLLQRAFPAVYVTANLAGEQLSTDFARTM